MRIESLWNIVASFAWRWKPTQWATCPSKKVARRASAFPCHFRTFWLKGISYNFFQTLNLKLFVSSFAYFMHMIKLIFIAHYIVSSQDDENTLETAPAHILYDFNIFCTQLQFYFKIKLNRFTAQSLDTWRKSEHILHLRILRFFFRWKPVNVKV